MDEKALFVLSSNFYELTKKANDIRTNMAKRIMFSLLAHLVPAGESFRIAATKGAVDPKVLKQMIPGAKELIEYGTEASISEAMHHEQYRQNEGPVYEKIKKAFSANVNNDNKTALTILTDVFKNEKWEEFFGGANWGKITETLLRIHNHLDAAIEAKKSSDWEKEIEELMAMTAYMNVLDGLAHNTGSIMEKMLILEKNKKPVKYKDKDVFRLMDAKELKDPDEVLHEVLPVLEKSDAPLTMKDWVHKAREKRFENNDPEKRDKALAKIRLKKDLMNTFQLYGADQAEKKLIRLYKIPDNFFAEEVVKTQDIFYNLMVLAKKFLNLKNLLSKEYIEQIESYRSILQNYKPVRDSRLLNEKIETNPAVKNSILEYIDNAISLIQLFRKIIDSLTE